MSKWLTVKLGEVVTSAERAQTPMPGTNYRQIGVKLWGEGAYERETMDGSQTRYAQLFRAEAGDIIVNKIWARNGSVAVVPESLAGCFGSSEFPMFAPKPDRLDSRWVHWLTKTPNFWAQCDEKSRGTSGKNRIKPEQFLKVEIPLPPLTEQHRVLTRIEELAAQIHEARTLRRQAAEEAEALLPATRQQFFNNGEWTSKRLDEVAPINMGQSPSGSSYNDAGHGAPLLNGPTEFGEHHPTPVQWTTAPTKFCKSGDILLCVRGATTGRMNWADREYCIGRGLAALTVKAEACLRELVYHFVATRTREMLALSAGSTFPNLPGAKLKTLEIPVPPLPEQRRIVAELDALQAEVDALQRLQAETAAELDALLPSILDKAFKGEL